METAGLIVGVVSFGLQLATTLQTYVEVVAGAADRIEALTADVGSTASALKQLQDILDADKAAEEAARAAVTVFKEQGRRDIESLAFRCEKTYRAIIHVIVSATAPPSERRRIIVAKLGISDITFARLAELGRNLKWPWVEPRVKACQEELRWLRMSLVLHLQIGTLARYQLGVANASSSGSEKERIALTRMAERLQARRSEYSRERRRSRYPNPGRRASTETPAERPRSEPNESIKLQQASGQTQDTGPAEDGIMPANDQGDERERADQDKREEEGQGQHTMEEEGPTQNSAEAAKPAQPVTNASSSSPTLYGGRPSTDEHQEPRKLSDRLLRRLPIQIHKLFDRHGAIWRALVLEHDDQAVELEAYLAIGVWRRLETETESEWELELELARAPTKLPFTRHVLVDELQRLHRRRGNKSAWDEYMAQGSQGRRVVKHVISTTVRLDGRKRTCVGLETRSHPAFPRQASLLVFLAVAGSADSLDIGGFWLQDTGEHITALPWDVPDVRKRVDRGEFYFQLATGTFIAEASWPTLVRPGASLRMVLLGDYPYGSKK
ncbi:hypothetical protein SODALDRAFT_324298 [Sodiomyces alkalinus F11]|uniref:Fungal N-terminal domain-containing protein n=1 Tax=Sodiomyces alkalinus (strain CBS 110278 / VKM F-3762 / F11) TaxID=1314773 RepID=A0A3N2PTF7_SODAK|nr:hypothetical protein SODALDRAFT_324298 [Sodiomyces alkalinus F11]ROT37797.1 hypothetical protein SODALDRAFT_324298 [Sodiomyces alkalinus F11]